jgi:uncharacterized protein (DUF58 family)
LRARRSKGLRGSRKLRATRAGWCFVAIIFGVGFAALNTGNNLLYLVLALMLGFLVLSGVLSEVALRGLRVERLLPREIFARGDNRVVLRLSNDQKRFPAFAISADDRFSRSSRSQDEKSAGRCFALRIGAGATADRTYLFNPPERGEHEFVSCRLSTRFPFGLFVKSVEYDLEDKMLVYPELRATRRGDALKPPDRGGDDQPGRGSGGEDLAGLREYRRGDPMSRLHWRSSLRTGKLIVVDREGLPDAEVDVVLDLSADLDEEEIEIRISEAATALVTHLEAGCRVGLKTRACHFEPDSGPAHRSLMLAYLAREARP